MNSIKISVIIPTCHRNDMLSKCLDCISPDTQTYPSNNYEVIVTDDGSVSTAEAMIREKYSWAKWVAGPRTGPAANRNNGAKQGVGEWFVFIDDDCLPDKNCLDAYVKHMDTDALALEGSIVPTEPLGRDMQECPVNTTGGYFWSANVAIKASTFEEIGGFDPKYALAAFEDQDIYMRLKPLTKIPFISESIVYHPVRVRPYKDVLRGMPKRWKAYGYHANKHRVALQIRGPIIYTLKQYRAFLPHVVRNLLRRHYKKAFLYVYYLIVGVPMEIMFIRRQAIENKK